MPQSTATKINSLLPPGHACHTQRRVYCHLNAFVTLLNLCKWEPSWSRLQPPDRSQSSRAMHRTCYAAECGTALTCAVDLHSLLVLRQSQVLQFQEPSSTCGGSASWSPAQCQLSYVDVAHRRHPRKHVLQQHNHVEKVRSLRSSTRNVRRCPRENATAVLQQRLCPSLDGHR